MSGESLSEETENDSNPLCTLSPHVPTPLETAVGQTLLGKYRIMALDNSAGDRRFAALEVYAGEPDDSSKSELATHA